jgi:hypothetical protein
MSHHGRRRFRSSLTPGHVPSFLIRAPGGRVGLALVLAAFAGLWPATGQAGDLFMLENRGGPMLAAPEIAPIYLGAWTPELIASTQAYLAGLVGYLSGQGAPRGRESVLRQYGVLGASLLPPVGPIAVQSTINRSDVTAVIRGAQAQPGVYGYAPGRIVLAMTSGVPTVNLGTGVAAFHDVDGTDQIFAFVPTELDPPPTTFQDFISHELFEAATDPYWHNTAFGNRQAWIYWKEKDFCFPGFGCAGDTAEGADECGSDQALSFGSVSTFFDNTRLACDAWSTAPQPVAGDFDGDGWSDVALVGGNRNNGDGRASWGVVPIAYADGYGGFPRVTTSINPYAYLADVDNVTVLSGDFDGDGATDLAFVGGVGWATTPVLFSNRDGTFRFVNQGDAQFAAWAQTPGVQAVAGDFDGDHRTDIALAGGDGWATVPMAFSNGDGTFQIENYAGRPGLLGSAPEFAWRMTNPGAKLIAGQFDGTGKASLGVIGQADQSAMFLKYQHDSTDYAYAYDQDFSEWSALPGVKAFTGDFDGDGYDDVGLSGGPGWYSVPIAFTTFATGKQRFSVQNVIQYDFGIWATVAGVTPVAGRFVSEQQSDIALVGGWGWGTVPIDYLAPFPYSHSPPYDTFRYALNPVVGSSFPAWAQ